MLGERTEKMFGMLPVIFPRDAIDITRTLREAAIVLIALQGQFGPLGSCFKGSGQAATRPFSGLIDRLHLFRFWIAGTRSECVRRCRAGRMTQPVPLFI